MKIIQTFWSKPFLTENDNFQNRFNGGWSSKLLNCISIAYSCMQFKKYYNKVELYTDTPGKELLIDKLKLPYTKVNIVLDDFDYTSKLWALAKVKTYSLQTEPFIHADNDVFIFDKLPERIENAQLLAQNECIDFITLYKTMKEINIHFNTIDTCIYNDYITSNELIFGNCGIIGGNNIDFFQQYCKRVFTVIEENIDKLQYTSTEMMGQVYEEYLYYSLASALGIDIEFLLPPFYIDFNSDIVNFKSNYVHIIGTFKKMEDTTKIIEKRFKSEYPEKYNLIKKLIADNKI
jgi:hypothetical protein